MIDREFANFGELFATRLMVQLRKHVKEVPQLDMREFIHEHTHSASMAALSELGYYSYCETTPILSEFDKHLSKRERSTDRGRRDIISFKENKRIVITEIESWKEIVEKHMKDLLKRIEAFRKFPSSTAEFSLNFVLVWDSRGPKQSILKMIKSRLEKMSIHEVKKKDDFKLRCQPIYSNLVSIGIQTEVPDLLECLVFTDGFRQQIF
ncbi:MAG: hypothetical protein ACFFER_00850 [Candidatus Thorarchaeota archaeon]